VDVYPPDRKAKIVLTFADYKLLYYHMYRGDISAPRSDPVEVMGLMKRIWDSFE
jgi:hypothetical protein